LLKDGNPVNRAALARKAKAFFGNEASHLANILDGQQRDDSVKAAITRYRIDANVHAGQSKRFGS
jgi:hypothetical protein